MNFSVEGIASFAAGVLVALAIVFFAKLRRKVD
jgi:hypothetical protein